jgi:hypothetical protein
MNFWKFLNTHILLDNTTFSGLFNKHLMQNAQRAFNRNLKNKFLRNTYVTNLSASKSVKTKVVLTMYE